ncbi:MAG: hypothetical protein FD173_741 [Gallionellaceae bacterium]|nr:MAG: hypothetical protein FD173_741 [Gallionellaceae bacterium]
MKTFNNVGFLCIALLCWVGSVSAYQESPVECVVELVKNDIVIERYSGGCGYAMPFIVEPSIRKTFSSSVLQKSQSGELELIKTDAHLGFSATVYVGNNLTEQNSMTGGFKHQVQITQRDAA